MTDWDPLNQINWNATIHCQLCEQAIGTYCLRDHPKEQERAQKQHKDRHAERCQIQILREIRDLLRQQP